MDKSKIYLDLSKCTEDERKNIFSLLPEPRDYWLFSISYKCSSLAYVQNETHGFEWVVCVNTAMDGRSELTYPEFIKLFEGGEGENPYRPMTEFPPITEGEQHSKMVLVFDEDLNDYDLGFYDFELQKWLVMGDFQMNLICWMHIEKPMYEDVQEYPTILTD